MESKWQYLEIEDDDLQSKLLKSRGIEKPEDIKEFLSNMPKKTYNPMEINGMKELIGKIVDTINLNKKIVIAGDYDMDGIGAVAVLVEYLLKITDNVDYYIPNRYKDGYGLSNNAIDYIKDELNGDLVITVDNGISCYSEIEYAKSRNLEIIVTDHHNPPKQIPDCLVLDLKLERDNYPFRELCGCGLAFKICQGLNSIYKRTKQELLKLTDIVALSTIGDVVALIDENRTLVKFGIMQLKTQNRIGIKALCDEIGINCNDIKSGTIGFRLAPCFNASGRMEDAKIGVELLLTKDTSRAKELASYLKNLNDERRKIQEIGESKCIETVKNYYQDDLFLVVREDSVSEGVMGIIAGRLRDKFYKPVLVMTKTETGKLKASGRSIDGIDLYAEMCKCDDLFIGYGGHANACGLSMEEGNLEILRARLNKQMNLIKSENKDVYVPKIKLVADVNPKDINFELLDIINKLEPFGMGNATPIFGIKNVTLNQNSKKYCGEKNQHLKISGKKDSIYLNGIGFSMGEAYLELGEPECMDLAFVPKVNEWNGNKSVQLMVKDFKECIY